MFSRSYAKRRHRSKDLLLGDICATNGDLQLPWTVIAYPCMVYRTRKRITSTIGCGLYAFSNSLRHDGVLPRSARVSGADRYMSFSTSAVRRGRCTHSAARTWRSMLLTICRKAAALSSTIPTSTSHEAQTADHLNFGCHPASPTVGSNVSASVLDWATR